MPKMPSMLIISTPADISLGLFKDRAASVLIASDSITYEEVFSSGVDNLKRSYDYVYFRDPFNDGPTDYELIQQAVKFIVNAFSSAYFVDNVTSFKNLLFEDKWAQYQKLSRYMPKTELLRSLDLPKDNPYFIKKRLSSRSKGVIFTEADFPEDAQPSDYVMQEKLNIETEYRVFMVGGDIFRPIAIKTSKTTNQKVKVIGLEEKVHSQIINLCDAAYSCTKYDLMGLDIAKVGDTYYLLEVNRSCQFNGYLLKSSINLAGKLDQYLLTLGSGN